MANKKKQIRKISKSEKSLANKITYLNKKLKDLRSEMFEYREMASFNYKQKLKDKKSGDLKTLSTLEGEIIKKGLEIANKIEELQIKREKRFKKYKPRKRRERAGIDEDNFFSENSYLAWEKVNFFQDYQVSDFEKINGIKTDTNMDKILDEIERIFQITSREIVKVYTDESGENLELRVDEKPE